MASSPPSPSSSFSSSSSSHFSSSSAFSTGGRWFYEVFLSFRGPDTRQKFVSHLYKELDDKGILTFKDNPGLRIGDHISNRLGEVIRASRLAVVVLSQKYAASKWCLDELDLIMEHHRDKRHTVFPVFYEVKPSDVRWQKGSFEEAFKRYNDPAMAEKVDKWKKALREVADLSGAESTNYEDDAALIKKLVGDIYSQLFHTEKSDFSNIVGIETHMERMSPLLNIESEDEVRMIGIWGMGGIGKTTIAKCLYDRFSGRFPVHCFLDSIKNISKDPLELQKTFLSKILQLPIKKVGSREIKATLGDQKVFVVLDDVDHVDQLETLAKASWFGPGSRIIITTRDVGLLRSCRVETEYEVKCLGDDDALKMFKQIAFEGQSPPPSHLEQLSVQASRLARGLPSALKAYGQEFRGQMTRNEWENALKEFQTDPLTKVTDILRISFDGLEEGEQAAFCHVACLFNRDVFRRVAALLDNGEFRITKLAKRSLLDISTDGNISMHALVEQMGRQIVRQKSRDRPFEPRLLWDTQEIYSVLQSKTGTSQIEGMALHMCEMTDNLSVRSNTRRDVFKLMHNLKFLKFYKHLNNSESTLVTISYGNPHPCNLRLLHWDAYPSKTLPSRFRPHCLVELNLRYSKVKKLWKGTLDLGRLRRLDVTGSKNLTRLPDLSSATQFQELIIEGCTKLKRIPESVCNLSSLKKLEASRCNCPTSKPIIIKESTPPQESGEGRKITLEFPNATEPLNSLTNLSIEGDIDIQMPILHGRGKHLFFSSGQNILDECRLTSDFYGSKSLDIKQINYSKEGAPFRCSSFSNFPFLTALTLINLNIGEIPGDIGHLAALEKLDLSGNDFKNLPTTMTKLSRLKYVRLFNCCILEELPKLTQLETLTLSNCTELQWLVNRSLAEEDIGRYRLLELGLHNCKNVQRLSDQLSHFTNLIELDLSGHDFETIPSSIKKLSSLGTLYLNDCKKLRSLEELQSSLKNIYAKNCVYLDHVDLRRDCHLYQNARMTTQSLADGQNGEALPQFASSSLLSRFLRFYSQSSTLGHIIVKRSQKAGKTVRKWFRSENL